MMENNISRVINFMVKGHSYKINNDYLCAIDCYDQVLQIDPKYKDALYCKGIAYL